MKAAVLREVRTPLQIEQVQISKPGPHEVLIRTAAAGLCHSDLHFIEGSYPFPPCSATKAPGWSRRSAPKYGPCSPAITSSLASPLSAATANTA